MNKDHSCGSDTVLRNSFEGNAESVGGAALPAFVVLPTSWASGFFCQTPANAQHALYLLACRQAEVVVRAVHRRRQLLFAHGVHLWN
jgi:hypothetical protein